MQTLPLTFTIFQVFGFWRPPSWTSEPLIRAYDAFTGFTYAITATFALSEMLGIFFNVRSVDELTESSFICLSIVSACFKALNILLKRRTLVALTNTLLAGSCKFRNKDEELVQRKFDAIARSNTIFYITMIMSSVLMLTTQSLLENVPSRTLPFPAWLPYNYTSSTEIYMLAYAHQLIGNATSAFLHVASDTLVSGMMIQICAQLEILRCRIEKLVEDEGTARVKERKGRDFVALKDIIEHHNCIYQFSKDVNKTFAMTIITQFLIATLVICTSVYQLSKMDLFSSNCVALASYLTCVVAQIFLYCWYGDAVTTQSLQVSATVYNVDWTVLDLGMKKSLLVMMVRARRPIEIKTGQIINMSLLSFTKIMKTSYSAFNFMEKM